MVMPPIEEMIASSNPFIFLIRTAVGSQAVATVITTGFTLIGVGCCLSAFSSSTRLTWAWARDGGCKHTPAFTHFSTTAYSY